MTAVQVHGTADPAEIAAVLIVLRRDRPGPRPRDGVAAWRDGRRAALTPMDRRRRPERQTN
jgi:hypothetical protein